MPNYALAVVPANWDENAPLTFSEAQYNDVRHKVEAGTRLILFRAGPENAIIGQGQTPGVFLRTSEWPQENLGQIDPSDPEQAYLLPIEVLLLLKGPVAPVPVTRVREVLDDPGFPHVGERWRVLEREEYDALRDGWT